MNHHSWIIGSGLAPRMGITVDCHRRLRGPYTGVGSLLRILIPQLTGCEEDLVKAHAIEIGAIAPDLSGLVGVPLQTLTELSPRNERTRMYSRTRTTRLAHGVTDLLLAWAARQELGPPALTFSRVDEADFTDQEFLSILLRRAPRNSVEVVVASRNENVTGELAAALNTYARRIGEPLPERHRSAREAAELLRAYIVADGTSADPAEIAAYQDADPSERAALHDERAAQLERTGDWSLRLGAIPYHLEHGTDRGAAIRTLREALDHCIYRSFYHASIDFGQRGRAIGDSGDGLHYWHFTYYAGLGHAALGQPDEAEVFYQEIWRHCVTPSMRIAASYGMAMLCTRFRTPEHRDHNLAREHICNAIAISSQEADPKKRLFHRVFNSNGLALVEMHMGDLSRALQLVTEGLEMLNQELPSTALLLLRSVLMNNAAHVLARLGRLDEALSQFSAAIDLDPNYPEYYFDRAAALRRLGRSAEALRDYDTAASVSLPFWELHHNRAAVRAELGDLAGASTDFERVVDLAPGQLDPWVSLVSLLLETGDLVSAGPRISQGLGIHPGDPQLLCARAQLWAAFGQADQARQDFNKALAADSGLVAALAGRADLSYQAGDYQAAIADLTIAIEMAGDDPDLRYNRALLYQATADWRAAIDDYTCALSLPGAGREELLIQLGQCYAQLGIHGHDLDEARRFPLHAFRIQ